MIETSLEGIEKMIQAIDPVRYASTRNYIDGNVTRLSPYISRGVISTKSVLKAVLNKSGWAESEKLIQELAWRDYYQQIWIAKKDQINEDLRQPQPDVRNYQMPASVLLAGTGIASIDSTINELYETGYMHNHCRMYVASLTCNIARSHWKIPAQWMYYHLLDADWASNACSWQWVAAAFSGKKYYANQENINRYTYSNQEDTFLDVPYERFMNLPVPEVLSELQSPALQTFLPDKHPVVINPAMPTFVYNFYNLDPFWKQEVNGNKVLLLEPSHFKKYPVSKKTIDFVLALSVNIKSIQVYVGEFDDLVREYQITDVHYKEHPTTIHYKGKKEEREWMFPVVKGYYPSFFAYWKKCGKIMKFSGNY